MASKSKRRRKVLGASCILAALIIAGSSFAWFTSSDEVTNRLSANADYGTKIVESFAPPENWLPGAEVNKDVYATNTGTIGAYVKETVSGALTVTAEKDTTTKTANSIKLTEEERYAVEAGAYLAYKPAASSKVVGNAVVVRPADENFPRMTDFTPDVGGLYVFRRSIDVDSATPGTETFEYDGYYFDGIDYYRISNLTYTLASAANQAADGNNHDGDLATATAGFVELETKTVDPTKLEYVKLTDEDTATAANVKNNKQYLVATYDVGSDDAQTKLKALAAAYDKAIHDYEYAAQLATRAATENTTATGTATTDLTNLNDAKDALDNAIAARDAAKRADDAAAQTLANATAAQSAANTANETAQAAVTSAAGEVSAAETAITAAGYTNDTAAFEAELEAFWNDSTTSPTGTYPGKSNVTVTQLEEFKTYIDAKYGTNSELHTNYTLLANKAIADRKKADADAKATQTAAALTAANEALTTATTAKAGTASTLEEKEGLLTTAQSQYESKLADYNASANTNAATKSKLDEANAALAAAAANKTAARIAYETAAAAIGTASDGQLKIWIKLSDDVVTAGGTANKWQMLPTSVDPTTNKAAFYHTSILEGGETSAKLVDSVSLDARTTQEMYKYFDFDLNVALDSVQVNYADDGKLLADGTASQLGASVAFADATDINTALTWS